MSGTYRIFGNELSPYSVKVRSYFRYKGIPHEWIVRSARTEEEFARHARLPLIPLVVSPEGSSLQDSTPILEKMEAVFPDPALQPSDPVTAFLSALLEEYADEWLNKAMFHYRWFYEPDQAVASERLARSLMPDVDPAQGALMIQARMIPRLKFVGSREETKDVIEDSYRTLLRHLETHLAIRPYVFGGRPALADFGLAGQLYELAIDPTPGAILRQEAPTVARWVERMLSPTGEGPFEDWSALAPTLEPLLREEVGQRFVPWTLANAAALAAGEETFSVEIAGRAFSQETQKYHARSLAALRARHAAVGVCDPLEAVLETAGCLAFLRA